MHKLQANIITPLAELCLRINREMDIPAAAVVTVADGLINASISVQFPELEAPVWHEVVTHFPSIEYNAERVRERFWCDFVANLPHTVDRVFAAREHAAAAPDAERQARVLARIEALKR